jgi:hypothetical protein
MNTGEYRVVYVCLFTVLGWIFKDNLVINDIICARLGKFGGYGGKCA